MAATGDSRKFVRLLAKQLLNANGGIEEYSYDDLAQHFRGAVDCLPDSDLKRSLSNSFSYCLKQLVSALKLSGKSVEEKDKAVEQPEEYNLFIKGGLDKLIKSSTCASTEQKMEVYKQLWHCYPAVSGTEKLFSIFSELLKEKYRGGSESNRLEASLEMIKKLQQMTFGSYNEQSVVDSLKFFLEEISSMCDGCSKLSSSKRKQQRAVTLRNVIKDLAVLMHFRFQECSRQKPDHNSKETYSDLMAAILSLYMDVYLLSESTDVSKHMGNILFLILGHSPSHSMDVLLQLTALSEDNISHILPLIRSVLKKNSTILKHSSFIKFVCLARLACSLGKNLLKDITAIRQIAESQPAPANFTSWLAKRDKRLVENLALSRKTPGVQVTKHLLDKAEEDDMESLLDVACDAVVADQSSEEQGEAVEAGDNGEAVLSGEGSLFFVDSTGDAVVEHSFQEIEYESNEAEEKLLHKQLTSLIDRLDEESESEEEETIDEILHSGSAGTEPVQLPSSIERNAFDTEEENVTVTKEHDLTCSSADNVRSLHCETDAGERNESPEIPIMESRESSEEQRETEPRFQPRRSKRTRAATAKPRSEDDESIQSKVRKEPKRSSRTTVVTRARTRK